jgi:hypothetical protein
MDTHYSRLIPDISEGMEGVMRIMKTRKGFVEDMTRLAITDLRDKGLLQEGSRSGTITPSQGRWATEVGFEVCFYPLKASFVVFSYTSNGKKTHDWFRIERISSTCVMRYYFRCRETGKLVSALYYANGCFDSRFAHGLTYRACSEHRTRNEYVGRYRKFKAKAESVKRITARTWKYAEKLERYERKMYEGLDRRCSKILDQIYRNDSMKETM